jgi:glycosyl transferase, family 25
MTMKPQIADVAEGAATGRSLGIFAINLDRSPDRWAQIERHFGHLAWPLQRIAAVDARKDPAAVLSVRGLSLQFPPDGVAWNSHRNRIFMLTEEACLAGHVLTWRQFLKTDLAHALVLEDDAEPQAGFAETLSELLQSEPSADIVKLEGVFRPGGRKVLPLRRFGAHRLVRSLRPASGSAAYLVTRRGAERLLARVDHICVPADDFLWNPAFHGCDVAHVSPWLIMQSGMASVIATDKSAKRASVRAPFGRAALMPLRRGFERLKLIWAVTDGRPWKLLNTMVAPWAPDDYNLKDRMSIAAIDRKSSNG